MADTAPGRCPSQTVGCGAPAAGPRLALSEDPLLAAASVSGSPRPGCPLPALGPTGSPCAESRGSWLHWGARLSSVRDLFPGVGVGALEPGRRRSSGLRGLGCGLQAGSALSSVGGSSFGLSPRPAPGRAFSPTGWAVPGPSPEGRRGASGARPGSCRHRCESSPRSHTRAGPRVQAVCVGGSSERGLPPVPGPALSSWGRRAASAWL